MSSTNLAILASLAFGLLGIGSAVQAATISANGPFTVEYFGNHEDPDGWYDPPLYFHGFFLIKENRVADFEFTVFDRTWTEADVRSCDCRTGFSDVSGEIEPSLLAFEWNDGPDGWQLLWHFDVQHQEYDYFRFQYQVDDFTMFGDSEGNHGFAGSAPDFAIRVNVPEPGTLALLGLGLAGLGSTRRRHLHHADSAFTASASA